MGKITEVANRSFNHADKCGFYKSDPPKEIMKKITEEAKEFICAVIGNAYGQNYRTDRALKYLKVGEVFRFENDVKNTVGDELADIVITALAGARKLGIDIEKHIIAKMEYNEIREDHK